VIARPLKIEITPAAARFIDGENLAGISVLDDPFKPYLHPPRTPDGHVVTVARPADHRHHKGLMYGLRCEDCAMASDGARSAPHSPTSQPGPLYSTNAMSPPVRHFPNPTRS